MLSKSGAKMKYRVKFSTNQVNKIIKNHFVEDTGEISDGFHTFNELYEHRTFLFSIICKQNKMDAWRSRLHNDGTMYKDYFIVGISTEEGDYSYHVHNKYWKDFYGIRLLIKAPEWDGHKPEDYSRLSSLLKNPANIENTTEKDIEKDTENQNWDYSI